MKDVLENNNEFTQFKQVLPEYIFSDIIPAEPPLSESARVSDFGRNKDDTQYRYSIFSTENPNQNWDYLIHLENFQLTKEFRQGKFWKLEFEGEEENLRRIILPGQNTTRTYTPKFYKKGSATPLPFTSIDPVFDLGNCRIQVGLDLDSLYIDCWLYVGKNLREILDNNLPPFNSKIWLLQDPDTKVLNRFELTQDKKVFVLPPDNLTELPEDDLIVTTKTLNWILNQIGCLDEGEYW